MKRYTIIPSLDVTDLDRATTLVKRTESHPLVSGYKVGFSLAMTHGLKKVAEVIRSATHKRIVYDHQKAATDIPDTGALFAETLWQCRVDHAILFPQAGPETLKAWVTALQSRSITVLVGGVMTHAAFLANEGGYLADNTPDRIYEDSRKLGVRHYVVPLTKPDRIAGIEWPDSAEFYSPGYGAQGGDPHAFPQLGVHHLFVGRAILQAPDPRKYLDETAKALTMPTSKKTS